MNEQCTVYFYEEVVKRVYISFRQYFFFGPEGLACERGGLGGSRIHRTKPNLPPPHEAIT